MAEDLQLSMGLDTAPMINSYEQAIKQLKGGFSGLYSQISKEFAQPIQMDLRLDVDKHKRSYDDLQDEIRRAKEEQHQLNLESKKSAKSAEIQKRLAGSVKVTANQLKNAKEKLKQMLTGFDKNSEAAKRVQGEIYKINERLKQMKAPQGMKGFFDGLVGKLTIAGTAANLLTKALGQIVGAGAGFIQTAAEMEVLGLQLEAFTGGAQEADAAFRRFAEIAAKTPFDLAQVAKAGKTMMAFGVESEKALKITEQLGVIAAATGGNLNELGRNMGQISAQGQAYTRDLTQFAMQGIPIWEEMGKVTGASVAELKKLASEGKISFDIVEQALTNMTAKGTEFEQVGRRMNDTWIGKTELVKSRVQELAKAFVEMGDNLASALGVNVKGILDGIAGAIQAVAENIDTVAAAVGGLAAALGALAIMDIIHQILTFGRAAKVVKVAVAAWEAATTLLFAAKSALMALLNPANLLKTVAAVGIGVAAYHGLKGALRGAREEAAALAQQQQEAMNNTAQTSVALGMTYEEAGKKYKNATKENIAQLKKLEAKKADLIQQEIRRELAYKQSREAAKEAHEEIMRGYKSQEQALSNKIAMLEKERAAIMQKGPAQQKLDALYRRELEYTAKTGKQLKGHVTDKERAKIQAQAQLEALKKQEQAALKQKEIDQQRAELARIQKESQEQMLQYRADEAKAQQENRDLAEGTKTSMDGVKTAIEDLVTSIKDGMAPGLSRAKTEAQKIKKPVQDTVPVLNQSADAAGRLSSNLASATANANRLATAIKNIPSAPKEKAENAFTGGPVSGGQLRTVNELGKEAFLSASGRLSMINAPAWGEWRAPSSGTIIPAHLTKQLDIPTGGINLNKTPGANASVPSAVRTVQGAGGDVFNQSVTVQAANPVQAANSMMVEMTRLRRRRFR